jgi:hypothetical protein
LSTTFQIKKICNEPDRPPYSHQVDRYFEQFVLDNIITPLHLQTGNVLLSIMLLSKQDVQGDGISIYKPSSIPEERLTFYPVSIILDEVYNGDSVMENMISLYFQVICLFFRNYFPTVTSEFLLGLKDKLDWDFLLSLPYPAPFEDQQYVGDDFLTRNN